MLDENYEKQGKKPWRVEYTFKELYIGIDDDPMSQLFTN